MTAECVTLLHHLQCCSLTMQVITNFRRGFAVAQVDGNPMVSWWAVQVLVVTVQMRLVQHLIQVPAQSMPAILSFSKHFQRAKPDGTWLTITNIPAVMREDVLRFMAPAHPHMLLKSAA